MSCQEIHERFNDYLDDELSPSARLRVEEHLERCAECREELAGLESLLEASAALPREIEPDRNLWPSIDGRLVRSEPVVARGDWWSQSWVGLAAAAVLIAAVTLQVVRRTDEAVPVAEPPMVAVSEAVATYARISEEVRARNGLQQVREDLLRTIIERRESLDPETQELIDRNLEVIDRAVAEIYQALEENPENQQLEFMLAATYQREVEFLKKMNLL